MRTHLASLVDDFRAHAAETAVVSHRGVRRYASTYGDLAQLAGRFSAELERRQIRAGDRVVLWGENSAEWIGAFFGCLLRGVLPVPLDAAGSAAFAQQVLIEVAPQLIVGDASLLRAIEIRAVNIDALKIPEIPKILFSGMALNLPLSPNFAVDPSVVEDAPFQIVFTSGTTSEPKGIVHTHRNVLASLRPIEAEIAKYRKYERWVHPLRFLHTLPLSHVFGQFMGLWVPAILSAEVHFTDALEPARTLELTHRERISVLIAVPRVLELLRTHLLRRFPSLPEELGRAGTLSTLSRWWRFRAVHRAFGWKFWAVISGGATLPAELERFWHALGFALIQGYGLTETAALVTLNHPFRVGQGTIGKALPGREVRLSETGEILVRGDMVSRASWQHGRMQQRPMQTQQDDWLATGDLAQQSATGELRFLGRKGDAIVTSSGLNIHPADLEAAMLKQPGVRGCVVLPCQFATGAEPVSVLLFAGDDAALQEVLRHANRGLAEYQQIRRALRWPEPDFPYTSTGKLLRRNVRDWACSVAQGRGGTDAAPGVAPGSTWLALIAEITGETYAGITGDPPTADRLRLSEDLHLDSLGRVQLASAIEQRTGFELGAEQMASLETLGQLRELLDTENARESSGQNASAGMVSLERIQSASATNAASATRALEQRTKPGPHLYPRWPRWWPVKLVRTVFVEAILRPLVRLLLAPRVEDRSRGIPAGPLLIIANHVTALDGALVLYALPARLRRRLAIAMSGEMLQDFRFGGGGRTLWQKIFGPAAYWLLTALFNVFPLPRLGGFRRSFAHAGEVMDRGGSVLLFPEGARSRGERMAAFRPGIGLLAAGAHVPVLPVALIGLRELRSRQVNWFRSGRLEIRIGDSIELPDATPPSQWTQALEAAVRRLGG